jgi:predicted SAM-dependent methyltransferase
VIERRRGGAPRLRPHEVDVGRLRSEVTLGRDDEPSLGGGWHGPEGEGEETFRWMGRIGRLYLPADADARIELELEPYLPAGLPEPPTLTVDIDGATAGPFVLDAPGRRTIAIDAPGSEAGPFARRVDLVANAAHRPADREPGNGDRRELAFRVYRVRTSGASVALGRSEGDVLATHVGSPSPVVDGRTEVRWVGSWRRDGDGACVPQRDGAGSFADVVVRRGAGVEGDVSLRYRDDGEGSFEVTVLDATLRATHRRRVRLEGSGRVRAARLPWPGDAPAACLVVEPHGVEPAVVSVETVRRDPARVNLGCGSDHRPGMVNLDFRALDGVDVRADVTRLPWASGTVDELLADDVLEHFPWARSRAVVAEWVRVLRPGGTITIRTPSLEGVLRLYRERPTGWGRDEGEIDPIVVRLFGGQEYPGNFHHAIFDLRSLQALLEEAGLGILELGFDGEDVSNLVAVAAKPAPERAPAVGEPAGSLLEVVGAAT